MAKIQGADVKTEAELITAGATASSLIQDTQIYVSALSLNKTLDDAIIDGDIGGAGGSSGVIVGDDSDLDVDVGAWLAYADAAGVQPVDGDGGSPVLTVTRTTSTPLHGNGSLLLDKDAADRQGNGASLLKTVEPKFRGKPLKFSFVYEASANFSFASQASDVQAFLYDVTNSQLLSPNPIFLDGSGYYAGSIQLPTNCASIRIILHVATTNALAWTLKCDDFDLDLNANEFINSQSDWVAYTPVFQGFGTVTNQEIYYRENGPDLEIQAKFTCGTVTASEAQFGLPNGRKVSSIITSIQNVGEVIVKATTSGNFNQNALAVAGNSYLNFGIKSAANDGLTALAGNVAFSNTIVVSFFARVPAAGLTSGYAHPAAIGLNSLVSFVGTQVTEALTANVTNVTFTATKDTTGSWSTNIYNVRSPGDYQVDASIVVSGAAALHVYKNGSLYRSIGGSTTAGFVMSGSVVVPDLIYGDTISIRSNTSVTGTIGTLSIFKVGSQAQPYAPRIAYLKELQASGTAGHAGATFTSGSFATRFLNTSSGDLSFVSLSSNQFTLQPGTYHIEASSPAFFCDQHVTKLRNITDSTDTIIGSVEMAAVNPQNTSTSRSEINDVFSITSAKVFEIQHRCTTTRATNGFGIASSFSVSNVYTQVRITKVL